MKYQRPKLSGYPSALSVYEVSSCPPNESLWKETAAQLGCQVKTQPPFRHFYYCIPTQSKSKLVEFCYNGVSKATTKDVCQVLGDNGRLRNYHCTKFMEGCPTMSYLTETIYKYPACFRVNTDDKCYLAEEGCLPSKRQISEDPGINLSSTQLYHVSTKQENIIQVTNIETLYSSHIMTSKTLTSTVTQLVSSGAAFDIYPLIIVIIVLSTLLMVMTILQARRKYLKRRGRLSRSQDHDVREHDVEHYQVISDVINSHHVDLDPTSGYDSINSSHLQAKGLLISPFLPSHTQVKRNTTSHFQDTPDLHEEGRKKENAGNSDVEMNISRTSTSGPNVNTIDIPVAKKENTELDRVPDYNVVETYDYAASTSSITSENEYLTPVRKRNIYTQIVDLNEIQLNVDDSSGDCHSSLIVIPYLDHSQKDTSVGCRDSLNYDDFLGFEGDTYTAQGQCESGDTSSSEIDLK